MPQTSCFISPPKTHCDLLAGSGVIPFFTHEREGSCLHGAVGQVCLTDVGPVAVHMCLPLEFRPLKSFQLIIS